MKMSFDRQKGLSVGNKQPRRLLHAAISRPYAEPYAVGSPKSQTRGRRALAREADVRRARRRRARPRAAQQLVEFLRGEEMAYLRLSRNFITEVENKGVTGNQFVAIMDCVTLGATKSVYEATLGVSLKTIYAVAVRKIRQHVFI